MTKKEIFDKIAETCADVCNVSVEDIINGSRKEDVVTARTLLIFWTDAAGFSVESLVKCTESNSPNSINSVKARVEEYWSNRFAFHVLLKEIGKRLLEFAHSIGEDFDVQKPVNHLRRITGKY